MNSIKELFRNEVFTTPILAWFVAQTLKVIIDVRKQSKIDFRRFVGSGGMPSSHAAYVMALTTVVGRTQGVGSPLFGISVAISLIVMYDATGVRRAAGKQAQVLNKLIHSHYSDKFTIEEKLKELIGHSPIEVLMGALLGLFFGLVM